MTAVTEARRIQSEAGITLPADVEALIGRIEAAPTREEKIALLDEMDSLKAQHGMSRYNEATGITTTTAESHLVWAITSSLCGEEEDAEVGLAWLRDKVA